MIFPMLHTYVVVKRDKTIVIKPGCSGHCKGEVVPGKIHIAIEILKITQSNV